MDGWTIAAILYSKQSKHRPPGHRHRHCAAAISPIDRATEVFKSEISRNELRELCNIMSDPPSTS